MTHTLPAWLQAHTGGQQACGHCAHSLYKRASACALLIVECAPGRCLHKSPLQRQPRRRLPRGCRPGTGRCDQATGCGRNESQRDCLCRVRTWCRLCHCKVRGACSALLSTLSSHQRSCSNTAWTRLLHGQVLKRNALSLSTGVAAAAASNCAGSRQSRRRPCAGTQRWPLRQHSSRVRVAAD